eukprot:6290495-Pyramimonas_sp.AAC.1
MPALPASDWSVVRIYLEPFYRRRIQFSPNSFTSAACPCRGTLAPVRAVLAWRTHRNQSDAGSA